MYRLFILNKKHVDDRMTNYAAMPINVHSINLTHLDADNSTNFNGSLHNVTNSGFGITIHISWPLYMTRLIVQSYLVPIVVTCGIVGNLFNIIVLVNPKMRTSTNVYLMALAICDSMYLLFCLSLSFAHCTNNEDQSAFAYYYIPYGRVFSDLFGNTAVWLTVCFTLERFIAVRLPMRGKAWCTVRKAKVATCSTLVLCFINTFPEIFEMKIETSRNDVNKVIYMCEYTEFAKTDSYQIGYYWWYVNIFTFTPLLLLSVFNSLLIRSVWEANKNRQILSNTRVIGETLKQNSEQQRVTTMLISVVLIFILCQTPQAILLVYRSYLNANNLPHPMDLLKIGGNICNLLVQINASCNFLLYSYFSSKFRRTFKTVLCCCKHRPRFRSTRATSSLSHTCQKSSSTTGTTMTSSSTSSFYRSKVNKDIVVKKHPGSLIVGLKSCETELN